jgi:hypothetical protein
LLFPNTGILGEGTSFSSHAKKYSKQTWPKRKVMDNEPDFEFIIKKIR